MQYYTPDLSEFHVGFEYEVKTPTTDWASAIFSEDDLKRGFPDIHEEYRVKKLYYDDLVGQLKLIISIQIL